jgi:hypothetical protein
MEKNQRIIHPTFAGQWPGCNLGDAVAEESSAAKRPAANPAASRQTAKKHSTVHPNRARKPVKRSKQEPNPGQRTLDVTNV